MCLNNNKQLNKKIKQLIYIILVKNITMSVKLKWSEKEEHVWCSQRKGTKINKD